MSLPPARQADYMVDWGGVAKALKEQPGEFVLLSQFGLEDTPRLRALRNSVRQGDIVVLVELGGVVEVAERNSRSIGGRRRRGDLWLRWDPDADPVGYYAPRAVEVHRRMGRI